MRKHLLALALVPVALTGCGMMERPADQRTTTPIQSEGVAEPKNGGSAQTFYIYAGCDYCVVYAERAGNRWILFRVDDGRLEFESTRWPGNRLSEVERVADKASTPPQALVPHQPIHPEGRGMRIIPHYPATRKDRLHWT